MYEPYMPPCFDKPLLNQYYISNPSLPHVLVVIYHYSHANIFWIPEPNQTLHATESADLLLNWSALLTEDTYVTNPLNFRDKIILAHLLFVSLQ